MALAERSRFPRIARDPRIQGGEPVVRGTRVPVRAIVVAWREYHDIPTLLEAYPRLTADAVKEALAYHDAHRRELDDLISAQLAAHAALADDLQPSESVLAEQPSQTGQHLG